MSEPVRIVTPRLQAALVEVALCLDEAIEAVTVPHVPAEALARAERAALVRAELLEAFEEAISGRNEPAEDPKEIEE